MNCEQARKIDIVDFLGRLGFSPARHPKPQIYWFHSPFRDENTPSFKVDRSANEWRDFGIGEGGSIIDLGIKLYGCTVSEFLDRLQSGVYGNDLVRLKEIKPRSTEPGIEIISVKPLSHPALYNYLLERAISLSIARRYLQEVVFRIDKKEQFALGFPNRSGGYELRNRLFKGSSSPKDIFIERHGSNELAMFEGFMDFLSFMTDPRQSLKQLPDILVLNSTTNFVKALELMDDYQRCRLFLDNDDTGRAYTKLFIEASSNPKSVGDGASLYTGFKDYNAWWILQQQQIRIRYPTQLPKL
ncbi:toprim domain-containing protein [Chitinophaga tropicalis]|uniref:DNA primase n=1 Tax=Chitinophaga tropicalis TaxID=2683588 RepID=A0A7K1U042_9BACT|nr:toprim domain-containing protein [Chitinophaga tropicalis]MVT07741.1 DNA primase [Chitinophaga tropicalis]